MICNHKYVYERDFLGVMDYGGTFVYGCQASYRCNYCGKLRWKMRSKQYKVLLPRKQNKNIQYQLNLL